MKLSFAHRTSAAVVLSTLALIVIAGLIENQANLQMGASRIVNDTQYQVDRLDKLWEDVGQMIDSEHAEIVTPSSAALKQYETDLAKLKASVDEVSAIDFSPGLSSTRDTLCKKIGRRIDLSTEILSALNSHNAADMLSRHAAASHSQLESIREGLDQLRNYEHARASDSISQIELTNRGSIWFTHFLVLLVFVLLVSESSFAVKFVSEKQRSEDLLRAAERRFRAVFNQTFQFTNLLSPDGTLLESSRSALEFAGLKQEEVVGKPFWEMPWWSQTQSTKERLKEAIARAASGDVVRFEEEQQGSNGPVTVDVSVKPVKDEQGHIIMLIPEARDITDRIAAEHARAERDARMHAIVDTAPDGIVTVAEGGVVESANAAVQDIFGYRPDELIGKHVDTILTGFFEGNPQDFLVADLQTSESKTVVRDKELNGIRKDGSTVPVELAVSVLNLGNRQILTAIVRDITERKEAERRVSEFYATVSHELRTPLTSIRTALGLLETSVVGKSAGKSKQLVRIGRSECDRLIRLINDILDIRKIEAGKMALKLQSAQPEVLVNTTFNALGGIARDSAVSLTSKINSKGEVECDVDRIVQVLNNLVANAIRFAPKDSAVQVEVENLTRGEEQFFRFWVIDSGQGIPEDQLARIWDRFLQLEGGQGASKGGSGLGLAISKAIVGQHGGTVGVECQANSGCRFWFELPQHAAVSNDQGQTPAESSKRILVVSDDDELVDLLNGLLSYGRFELARASTIAEGERIIASSPSLDLMMLNLRLPDGNGFDLLDQHLTANSPTATPIVVLPEREPQLHLLGNPLLIDWLIRPFSDDHLRRSLELAMSGHNIEQSTVLVLADSQTTKEYLKDKLDQMNIEMIDAQDKQTSQLISADSPDLIILDIAAPQQVCLDVLQVLRQEKTRPVPLMIYAAQSLKSNDIDKMTLAFTRHVSSSHMSEPQFLGTVRRLLDGRLRLLENQPR